MTSSGTAPGSGVGDGDGSDRPAPRRPDAAPGRRPDPGEVVSVRGQIACLVELAAPNPGNVRPGRDLPGLTATDMMMSAAAVGPALAAAGDASVGETVLRAIRDTRRWVDTNTNLGIVLLFAPVARAAVLSARRAPDASAGDGADLGDALETVLASTTVRDAELAYRAIRAAEAGGLGSVPEQDVSGRPTEPLREVMRRAADRDAVAGQYATGYRLLRSVAVPVLRAARDEGLGWDRAAHRCFARLLADRPDSLVARKFGRDEAESIRERARELTALGPPEGPEASPGWEALDRRLRSASPPRNPGTTADLTAAALFLALLREAGWNYPSRVQ